MEDQNDQTNQEEPSRIFDLEEERRINFKNAEFDRRPETHPA